MKAIIHPCQQGLSVEPAWGFRTPHFHEDAQSPPLSVEGREGSGVRPSDWNTYIGQVPYLL